jgi:hypothetical protein
MLGSQYHSMSPPKEESSHKSHQLLKFVLEKGLLKYHSVAPSSKDVQTFLKRAQISEKEVAGAMPLGMPWKLSNERIRIQNLSQPLYLINCFFILTQSP